MVEIIEKKNTVSPIRLVKYGTKDDIVKYDDIFDNNIALYDSENDDEYLAKIDYVSMDVYSDVNIEINWTTIYNMFMTNPYNLMFKCQDLKDVMTIIKLWIDRHFTNVKGFEHYNMSVEVDSIIDDLMNNHMCVFPNINSLIGDFGEERAYESYSGKTYQYYNDTYGVITVTIN